MITDDEVQFTYTTADANDAPRLKADFERELNNVKEHLSWLEANRPFGAGDF